MSRTRHKIGLFGLTIAAVCAMIGSGWLFGAWKAATIAGPAAIISWAIGAFIALLIALTYSELASRFPKTGGMVRYTQMTHGTFAGFIAGWAIWISIVSVIPVEAVSSVRYISSWSWAHSLYLPGVQQLSSLGLIVATLLVLIYFLLNYWSVKLFLRSMIFVTIFKFVVPTLTVIMLIYSAFAHHSATITHGSFMPYGISSVFTAVIMGGIIFSFNGFQVAVNFSGEAKNPRVNIPLSILLALITVFILYELLQIAFLTSIMPQDLIHGWHNLQMNSPFLNLAAAFGINWLVILLYIDAFVSPSGTGIAYTASTERMLYGMQKNGFMPAILGQVHPKYFISRPAMWMNLIVSYVFLFVFRGWGSLIAVISVTTIISYVNGPVSVMVLNKGMPSKTKIGRMMPIVAPVAFILVSLILYWARWPLTGEVIFIILLGLPIYFYYHAKKPGHRFIKHFKSGVWLVCYLLTIVFISFIGSTSFGGLGYLSTFGSSIAVVVSAYLYYCWGINCAIRYRVKIPKSKSMIVISKPNKMPV